MKECRDPVVINHQSTATGLRATSHESFQSSGRAASVLLMIIAMFRLILASDCDVREGWSAAGLRNWKVIASRRRVKRTARQIFMMPGWVAAGRRGAGIISCGNRQLRSTLLNPSAVGTTSVRGKLTQETADLPCKLVCGRW